MSNTIILYHATCTDGAGAMWSAWKFFKETAAYIAVGKLSKKQSNILKRCKAAAEVYMCDMMLDMENIEMIAESGTKIYLLDHHLSNINKLAAYQFSDKAMENINDHNDLSRSGAGITWDFFHSGLRPSCIDYIEDFDLWNWALPDGPSIHVFFSQFNWKTNDDIISVFNELEQLSPGQLAAKGTPLVHYRDQLIDRQITQVGRASILTYDVPILNSNQFISETAHIMAKDELFAAIWQQTKEGSIRMSFRSDEKGLDVQEIAGRVGKNGGGHIHAAGTSFPNYDAMLKQVKFL